MHFYRAMSISEYEKFLNGETIECEGTGDFKIDRICMMPAMVITENNGMTDALYNVYPSLYGIVNPEMFVKFEIQHDKLEELLLDETAIFRDMNYADSGLTRELQLKYYNSDICTPVEIQFAVKDFSYKPSEYKIFDGKEITADNLKETFLFEKIQRYNSGYNIDISNEVGAYRKNLFARDEWNYQFCPSPAAEGSNLHEFKNLITRYNKAYGDIFECDFMARMKSKEKQSFDIPVEFVMEYYFAAYELADATDFFSFCEFYENVR